ncbi:conserved hypothetical protein [Formosa agariphila KMM 3901]|uniref:DUF6876 domain-containing protein n=1 Tax=Formosa agariphila (strain DSM 15362 / KCTC 12365 / LMG 23005 / KMM 3901 / M-2Alg 35-1) TaxID=1347342 RepID=T2KRY2_FORAG|nr:DUF6876 family protein [Formosa agariphila]CDF80814.1 conserved hypothetical protein [Formosa agariphila KMM 3901]
MTTQAHILQHKLDHFCGSQTVFEIPTFGTRFTEGVQFLATEARCFWLITDASIIAHNLMAKSYFITIDFKRLPIEEQIKKGYEAKVTFSDGDENVFEIQTYQSTDFPFDTFKLFFIDNTLMLTSEY